MNKKEEIIINGCSYEFTLIEKTYTNKFLVRVVIKSNKPFSDLLTMCYLQKNIHFAPQIPEGHNVLPIGKIDSICSNRILNKKERIKLTKLKSEANLFSSKEETISFVKEYVDQLEKEYLENIEVYHNLTKKDLIKK